MYETRPTGVYPSKLVEGKFDAVYNRAGHGGSTKVVMDVAEGEQFIAERIAWTANFWEQRVAEAKGDSKKLIIDHHYYGLGNEQAGEPRGFGGRKFHIERLDVEGNVTERIVTTNLWSGGKIPEEFWDRLPDNARFVDGEHWVNIGGVFYLANGDKG